MDTGARTETKVVLLARHREGSTILAQDGLLRAHLGLGILVYNNTYSLRRGKSKSGTVPERKLRSFWCCTIVSGTPRTRGISGDKQLHAWSWKELVARHKGRDSYEAPGRALLED